MQFSLFPLCMMYIVLGMCIGPVWRPQHWAAYAACPTWKEGRMLPSLEKGGEGVAQSFNYNPTPPPFARYASY